MTFKFIRIIFLISLVTVSCNFAYCQEVINGGFEFVNSQKFPINWAVYTRQQNQQVKVDSLNFHSGKYAVFVNAKKMENASIDNSLLFANTYGAISTQKITRIKVSAYLKITEKKDSAVAIFIQSLSGNVIRKYLETKDIGQWKKINLEYTPSSEKPWYGFYYGIEISKNTDLLIDDIELEIDGKKIEDPKAFNYNPTKKDIRLLNKNLFPFESVDKENGNLNFNPVADLIGNSKLIGVGEPTHGTSEVSILKLKVFQYLVEKKGFTTFALEENIPTGDSMNVIINNPSVSLRESFLKMPFYKLWKTEEVLNILEWIRNYNTNHKNKLKFIGIDMEDSWLESSFNMLSPFAEKTPFSERFEKMKLDLANLKILNKAKKFDQAG